MGIAACCARPLGTLTGRIEFSGTHMSRQKTDRTLFRRWVDETLRGFWRSKKWTWAAKKSAPKADIESRVALPGFPVNALSLYRGKFSPFHKNLWSILYKTPSWNRPSPVLYYNQGKGESHVLSTTPLKIKWELLHKDEHSLKQIFRHTGVLPYENWWNW